MGKSQARHRQANARPCSVPVRIVEVREVAQNSPGGGLDCIAQLWAPHTNDWNERFFRGCFAKSLQQRVYHPGGSRCRVTDSHRWSCRDTYGTIREAEERDAGLWNRIEFASTDDAQDVRTKVKERHLDEFSIEFHAVIAGMVQEDDEMIREVREAVYWGLGILPYSSQGEPTLLEVRGATTPYQALPLAPDATPWDPAAALERVTAWAKGEGPAGGVNFARFGRAFAGEAPDARSPLETYTYQIADVVDGRLQVVPRALLRAAAQLVADETLDPEARAAVQAHLDTYFSRLSAEGRTTYRAPWKHGLDALLLEVRSGGRLPDGRRAEVREAVAELSAALGDAPAGAEPAVTPTSPDGQDAAGPATAPAPEAPPTTPTSSDDEAAARAAQLRLAELAMAELVLEGVT